MCLNKSIYIKYVHIDSVWKMILIVKLVINPAGRVSWPLGLSVTS